MIQCPSSYLRIETLNQLACREVSTLVPDHVAYLGQKGTHVLPGRLQQKLGPVTTHVLAQKVEAVIYVRDVGFLVGEFKTPLLQEVCHERLYFITEEFLRCARDHEVIRIAYQVDLVPRSLTTRGAKTPLQQRFQSIQGRVRQRRRGNASLRRSLRGGEEDVFVHESSLQPAPEYDPVHGYVGQ